MRLLTNLKGMVANLKATKDRKGEYHMDKCPLRNRNITLIDNYKGRKIPERYRDYCPCCGTRIYGNDVSVEWLND